MKSNDLLVQMAYIFGGKMRLQIWCKNFTLHYETVNNVFRFFQITCNEDFKTEKSSEMC